MHDLAQLTTQFYEKLSHNSPDYLHAHRGQGDIHKQLEQFSQGLPEQTKLLLHDEICGHGPLKTLLQDHSVTEILINAHNEIWVEKAGHLTKSELTFQTSNSYRNFLQRLQQEVGNEANMNHPFMDATWQGQRVHLSVPPITVSPVLSLRKAACTPWTFDRLGEVGWASPQQLKVLADIHSQKKSFLIVGGTSSGKTSVLNSFLQLTSQTERLVVLEDTAEVLLPNKASVRLLSRQDPQKLFPDILLQDLVRQSLRMRPDRVVMGEVRGPEAKDLLMAFATGHDGSCGTIHANSAAESMLRLEMLIQLGAPQWSLDAVRRLIFLSLRYLIVVQKGSDGRRRLEGVYRLSSLESFGVTLEKMA